MFAETIKKVVDNVGGGIGGVIMGLDGIAVEAYMRDSTQLDITTIGMEFSFILSQVRKATDSLQVGSCGELSVRADRLLLVIRMLNPQYFLAIALTHDGNFGKCRYLMRLATPALTAEL